MKSKKTKPLFLSKVTVVALDKEDLNKVKGGLFTLQTRCCWEPF